MIFTQPLVKLMSVKHDVSASYALWCGFASVRIPKLYDMNLI